MYLNPFFSKVNITYFDLLPRNLKHQGPVLLN